MLKSRIEILMNLFINRMMNIEEIWLFSFFFEYFFLKNTIRIKGFITVRVLFNFFVNIFENKIILRLAYFKFL